MRTRDEQKQAALFAAAIKVVNAIGFASSSVAKIAREANVSPATLYVYHRNKEDLLVSTYIEIKRNLGRAIIENYDSVLPIRDLLKQFWLNAFDYVASHRDHFQFAEQFSNSPYSEKVDKTRIEPYFAAVYDVLQNGIRQKIIKDVDMDVLSVFIFHPVLILANKRLCTGFEITDQNVEIAFDMAWDAIRR